MDQVKKFLYIQDALTVVEVKENIRFMTNSRMHADLEKASFLWVLDHPPKNDGEGTTANEWMNQLTEFWTGAPGIPLALNSPTIAHHNDEASSEEKKPLLLIFRKPDPSITWEWGMNLPSSSTCSSTLYVPFPDGKLHPPPR